MLVLLAELKEQGYFTVVGRVSRKCFLEKLCYSGKEYIINHKLLPYFAKRKICEITPKKVIAWQNTMLNYKDEKGKPYSPVYLKTLHNQLSAIFNHAVKYYNLREDPAAKVGNMGKSQGNGILDKRGVFKVCGCDDG